MLSVISGFLFTIKISIMFHNRTKVLRKIFTTFFATMSFKVGRWLFSSQFGPLLKQAKFCEAADAVVKIGLKLKSNHQSQF